jgi:hypothetical protein
MIDPAIVFSVIVGGGLTLIGTLLGTYLQYRSEERRSRKERTKERFKEVRRYLAVCLGFADLISTPTTMGPQSFGSGETKEFLDLVSSHLDEWKSLPVSSSARVLYVEDEKVLQWLKQIDELRLTFYLNYRSFIEHGQMIRLEDKRKDLQDLSAKVSARLDQLVDRV